MDHVPSHQTLKADAIRVVCSLAASTSRVAKVDILSAGLMTYKVVVRLQSGTSYVVRFFPHSRSRVVEYEPDLLRRCREAGARVPRMVVDSRSGPRCELTYAVYDFVPGMPLSLRAENLSTEEWTLLARDTAEEFRKILFEGFGDLVNAWQGALLASLIEPRNADYESAMDALAYSSRDKSEWVLIYTLVLGGLGSVIGVLIRSASNFVGVVCYKQNFNYARWWPWYFVRPWLAFLVGVLLVILIKSDLMTSSQRAGSDVSLWWVGLAALAGFGLEDFLDRLRVLSKTLFATDKGGGVDVTAGGSTTATTPSRQETIPGQTRAGRPTLTNGEVTNPPAVMA